MGYGSKLMVGRFPIAVIDIQIDLIWQMSMSPTKQEIRISKERELMALIVQLFQRACENRT
ncbi:hypothetical protein [Streptococcus equi]|uniref:hypothetical protein n=1 Tax=Streptococcus equi TaxID=1336 RepID=UPI0039C6E6DE